MNLQQARTNMIEQQVRPWDVLDQRVLDTLAGIAREDFVSQEHRGLAYSDYQLPIGFGQTMLKPVLEGRLLQTLGLDTTDSVLEIGTGSGYLTACIARLAGHVESVELHPELASSAAARLQALGIGNAVIRQQDASEVWDARDSYDAILFGGAIAGIPQWFRDKLAVGGRLLAVVGDPAQPTMEATLLTRLSEHDYTTDGLFETRLDPLINFQAATNEFIF